MIIPITVILSTDDAPTKRPSGTNADDPQPGLRTKPTDAELFSQDHPYYADSCTVCPFKGGKLMALLHDLSGKRDCNSCGGVNRVIKGKELKRKTDNVVGKKWLDRAQKNLDTIRETIDEHKGAIITNEMFVTSQMRVLRRSLTDVLEHGVEDNTLKAWLSKLNLSDIKDWKYEGWAECRLLKPGEKGYDPNRPKRKHPETEYFLYYSLKIQDKTYWANVKMHKHYKGEVLYTIEKNKPDDLIKGKHK